jgi:hypothetical protein
VEIRAPRVARRADPPARVRDRGTSRLLLYRSQLRSQRALRRQNRSMHGDRLIPPRGAGSMVRSDDRHHVERDGTPPVVQQHARVASSRACGAPAACSSQIRPSSVHFDVLLHGAGCAGCCNALVVVRPSISLARWATARHRAPTRTRAPTTTRAPTRARSFQISLSHHLGQQAQSSRSTSTPRLQRFRRRSALHR